jgi:hypothetical protein
MTSPTSVESLLRTCSDTRRRVREKEGGREGSREGGTYLGSDSLEARLGHAPHHLSMPCPRPSSEEVQHGTTLGIDTEKERLVKEEVDREEGEEGGREGGREGEDILLFSPAVPPALTLR